MAASTVDYKTHAFHTINSTPIELDIVSRPSALGASKQHKTLVYFHGGGLISGNRTSRFPGLPLDLLLQRGWLIITADYRLLPECGIADMVEDVRHLEDWILQEGEKLGVDLGQVAVGGSSAGSFLSILAISSWTKLQARVFYSLWSMVNTTDAWYSTQKSADTLLAGVPASHFQEKSIEHLLKPANPPVWDDRTEVTDPGSRVALFFWLLKEGKIGPMITASLKAALGKERLLDLVTASFPPTVAVHGTADSIAPVTDSRALISALAKVGVEGHLIEAEGADHGIHPQEKYQEEFEKSLDLVEQLLRR